MKKLVVMMVLVVCCVACTGCKAIGKTVTIYDDNGNIKSESHYDGDGNLVEKLVRAED